MNPDVITDPGLVAIARGLMEMEQATCSTCRDIREGGFGPSHFRSFIKEGERSVLINRPCESRSRVFDPKGQEFVGRAHCTCDSCF